MSSKSGNHAVIKIKGVGNDREFSSLQKLHDTLSKHYKGQHVSIVLMLDGVHH